MKKPAAGHMRLPVEYGKRVAAFTTEGGLGFTFNREGIFWAERKSVSGSESMDIVRTVAGVDVSDDITVLRTWAGHPVTSEHHLRIKDEIYSILSIAPSDDERMVEYRIVSGLRDTAG